MSQFSEMETRTRELLALNYRNGVVTNNYYTAQLDDSTGLVVAPMLSNAGFVQLFPITGEDADSLHAHYAKWVTANARLAERSLFENWPYVLLDDMPDLLTLKCIIEDAYAKHKEHHNAADQDRAVDGPAGEALE